MHTFIHYDRYNLLHMQYYILPNTTTCFGKYLSTNKVTNAITSCPQLELLLCHTMETYMKLFICGTQWNYSDNIHLYMIYLL